MPRIAIVAALCFIFIVPHAAVASEFDQGVTFRAYQVEGDIASVPVLAPNQTPNIDLLLPTISITSGDFNPLQAPIVAKVHAYLEVLEGEYTFRLTSDDGAKFYLDGQLIIDHDGRHAATPKESAAIQFHNERRELLIEYFDSGFDRSLKLEWRPPGADGFSLIPTEHLTTSSDLARVTSPGVKRIVNPLDARRAGDMRPVDGVHPGYTLTTYNIPGFEPRIGAMTFASDGRLIIGTFDPLQRTDEELPDIESKVPDKLYAISNLGDDPALATLTVAADNLYEPLGLCAVGDDLYVSHRLAITRLRDTDRDGFYETHETVASGWEGWNYHQFHFGLLHRDNKLYSALATAMAPPKWEGMGTNAAPNGMMRGVILETDLSTNTCNVIAGGCRTPNGLGFGPDGSLFYADNQGTWMPANQFTEVIPGRFYGHYNNTNIVPQLADRFPNGGVASTYCDLPRTPATLLLPQNECSNSPTQSLLISNGPYAGQMLIGELTAGGVRRAALERVNGQWQGAVFQFTQGLNCGVNRMAWAPDGSLFVGGIGAGGNWNWNNTRFGLQRLTPNGTVAFEMHSVSATTDGFIVRFTKPVDPAWLADAKNYTIRTWTYTFTPEYGGPNVDEHPLAVTHATPIDATSVRLAIPGLKPGYCVHLRTDPTSTDGEPIWSTEAWYTLNHIPVAVEPATLNAEPIAANGIGIGVLPPEHAAVLIGRSARASFVAATEADTRPTAGVTQHQMLAEPDYAEIVAGKGDLTSRTSFGDARLHLEWYCPPGGEGQMAANSGIYLQSLYELQVLGTLPGDRRLQFDEAGSIYKVRAPSVNASTGPGTWQAYDIWFRAPRFIEGQKTEPARLTVYWNGTLVHNDIVINSPTGSAASKGEPGPVRGETIQTGPLRLQDHATSAEGPVRFRNVWIAPLEPPADVTGQWTAPFDGKSLNGWSPRGGKATFSVEEHAIVGTTAPNTPNTFLVSEKPYANFELLLEVKQDPSLNSGIQFRSSIEGGLANREGRVVGYQFELDPSERSYSGGIYDEARRGWLYPLIDAPYARAAFKPNDWNQVRIVANGPIVRTWINGVPAACIHDDLARTGHIGLQVHDVGNDTTPRMVHFRNIRIRELN